MADRVTFTSGSAERIAKVVRIVEAGNRGTGALPIAPRFSGGGGSAIRVCTFTGSWLINNFKAVTLQGVTSTPNTVSATNQLFTIGDACTAQVAYITKVNSDWHLINVQHHETAVMVSVTLTTAALEFTRKLVWVPYPGETATLSIPLSTDTACSS